MPSLVGSVNNKQSLTGSLIPKGVDGKDGVGILSIEQTVKSTADGGVNVITFALTNGEKHTVEIRNGSSYNDAQLAAAIKKYLDENEITGGTTAKIGEVTLIADKWSGGSSLYSQVVTIDGVTENSQVDLTPSVAQLAAFYEKDLTFVTENANGVVTVYVIGQKPMNDYTIQVTITEVDYE